MTKGEFKRDRNGGINMSDPHNHKIAYERECQQWLAEHPGRTSAEFDKGLEVYPTGEVFQWRIAKAAAEDKAMRQAWLDEHPGEDPLPEHHCGWDDRMNRWLADRNGW